MLVKDIEEVYMLYPGFEHLFKTLSESVANPSRFNRTSKKILVSMKTIINRF